MPQLFPSLILRPPAMSICAKACAKVGFVELTCVANVEHCLKQVLVLPHMLLVHLQVVDSLDTLKQCGPCHALVPLFLPDELM